MKALIEKYFNGSTSHAEEKEICHYFTSGNHDPELEEYEKYFRYMASLKLHVGEMIPQEDYVDPVKDSNRKEKPDDMPPEVWENISRISKEIADKLFPESEATAEGAVISPQFSEGVDAAGERDTQPSRPLGTLPIKRSGMYLRIGIALSVAASLALLILFFPFWNTNDNFVVISGKKYADKEHTRLGIHTALNNVQLDTKPMFDNLDTHLLN